MYAKCNFKLFSPDEKKDSDNAVPEWQSSLNLEQSDPNTAEANKGKCRLIDLTSLVPRGPLLFAHHISLI